MSEDVDEDVNPRISSDRPLFDWVLHRYMEVGLPEFFVKYRHHLPLGWKSQAIFNPMVESNESGKQVAYIANVMMETLW